MSATCIRAGLVLWVETFNDDSALFILWFNIAIKSQLKLKKSLPKCRFIKTWSSLIDVLPDVSKCTWFIGRISNNSASLPAFNVSIKSVPLLISKFPFCAVPVAIKKFMWSVKNLGVFISMFAIIHLPLLL